MAPKQKALGKNTKSSKSQPAAAANNKKAKKNKQPDKKPHWQCHVCGKHRDLDKCKECKCGHPKCGQCLRFTQNRPNGDREGVDAGAEAVPRILEQKKQVKEKEVVVVVSKVVGKDKVKGDPVAVVV